MEQLKGYIIAMLIGVIGLLAARATIYPRVEADGAVVSIPALSSYQLCYEPNFADRKIVVDIDSTNGQPLEVGIVQESLLGDSMEASGTFARAAIPGSYRPSLVSGRTEGTTQSNLSDSWCLLAVNRSLNTVTADFTMRLYFRL